MIQPILSMLVFVALLVSVLSFAGAQEKQNNKTAVEPARAVSGEQVFKAYCAVCHGPGGKGDGPVAVALKVPPPDLTTLALRHGGKFPDEYVSTVLKNGVKAPAHGSGEMPVWGPIFETMSRWQSLCPGMDETSAAMRITNLTNYIKSIQKK